MAYPIINGNEFSFASATIDFGGKKFYGLQSINWSHELPPEDQYGNGAVAVGRTKGQYKASADFEQLLSEYDLLLAKLGDGYMEKPFNIGVQYRETPGAGLVKVEIIACRIAKEEVSNSKGAAGTTAKVTISTIVPIKTNGRSPVLVSANQGLRVSPAR